MRFAEGARFGFAKAMRFGRQALYITLVAGLLTARVAGATNSTNATNNATSPSLAVDSDADEMPAGYASVGEQKAYW